MKVIEKDNEIILRDIPFKKWLTGIFLLILFGLGGFAVFSDLVKYPNVELELQSNWLKISLNILWFLFIAAVIIVLWFVAVTELLIPQITTRIKPTAQTVDVITRKLLFFKKTERFYFSQVKAFEIIYPNSDESDLCFNILTLVNGAQIDLESTGSRKEETVEIQKKLNALLKKGKVKPAKNKSKRSKTPKTKEKMKAE